MQNPCDFTSKNKLEDFVGTLAKYLPISWQHENLQFVSTYKVKMEKDERVRKREVKYDKTASK